MVVTVVHNFLIITIVIPVRKGSKSYCLGYRILAKLDSIYELSRLQFKLMLFCNVNFHFLSVR